MVIADCVANSFFLFCEKYDKRIFEKNPMRTFLNPIFNHTFSYENIQIDFVDFKQYRNDLFLP